jgi:hypothetical protein
MPAAPEISRSFSEPGAPLASLRPKLSALTYLAAFDFLAPGMVVSFDNNYVGPMYAILGAVAGQVLLVSVWAVLGTGSFWTRWLAATAALSWLYAAFLAGLAVAEVNRSDQQIFWVNLFVLPVLLLAAQAPLWLIRVGLGRGLVKQEAAHATDDGVQFRIRDVLRTFALLGIALGLARLAVLLHDMNANERDRMEPWFNLAMTSATFSVWSAFAALPCVWAAFLAADRFVASLAVMAYVALSMLGVSAVVSMLGSWPLGEIVPPLLGFHAGLTTLVLIGCLTMRGWGYTLRRRGAVGDASSGSAIIK